MFYLPILPIADLCRFLPGLGSEGADERRQVRYAMAWAQNWLLTRSLSLGVQDQKKGADDTMTCPWCNHEMIPGKVYGDRLPLKWLNEDRKLTLGIWAIGGDTVGQYGRLGGFTRPRATGHRCLACKNIIIDESKTS